MSNPNDYGDYNDRDPLLGREGDDRRNINRHLPRSSTMARWFPCVLITAIIAFFIFVLIVVLRLGSDPGGYIVYKTAVTTTAFKEGLAKCEALKMELPSNHIHPEKERKMNPRHVDGQVPVLLTGGVVWDPVEGKKRQDVLLENGLIKNVSCCIQAPEGARVINVGGRIITPGMVDMHSHIGVDSWPALKGTDDTNEMTWPTLPQLRSLDGFNPHDPAIKTVASGGVTTVLVHPGSGNLMGGESFAFKLRPPVNGTVDEMLVNYGVKNGWRWMKMACGENPKRVYGSQGRIPSTRMGEAYMFRAKFQQAMDLVRSQNNWCESAARLDQGDPTIRMLEAFPEELSVESLAALIRGRVRLNVHCYETYDLEMMLRVAAEFGVKIASFHHALEAYQVPELMKKANVTIATFADLWGYKKEAYDASVKAPRILVDHGVPVALKSDHPVINSQYLMFEAAKAYHYGLYPQDALAAVTTVPAHAMGLGDRVGRVTNGMDADVVVWDIHPFRLGARPLQVFIDGQPQLDTSDDLSTDPTADAALAELESLDANDVKKMSHDKSSTACTHQGRTYTVRNIGRLIAGPGRVFDSVKSHEEVMIVVRDGVVRCAGYDCKPLVDGDVYYMNGGTVIPGLISSGVPLGLIDIEQEGSTGEGRVDGDSGLRKDAADLLRAEDGVAFGSKHMIAAYRAGITTSVASPILGRGVMSGLSAAFRTEAHNAMEENAFAKPVVALHVQIGSSGKHTSTPTISTQLAFLRGIFLGNLNNDPSDNIYAAVARGATPLIVHADSQDHIGAAVRLRQEIRFAFTKAGMKGDGMRIVIVGGAEAHLIATELAAEDVPVILQPGRCQPSTWDARRCLAGPPLTSHNTAQVLVKAGVKVSLAPEDIGTARGLIWEAGWTIHNSHHEIHDVDAVGMVTWNVANALGIQDVAGQIRVGDKAEFVGYDGEPFAMATRVMLIAGGTRNGVTCYPEQD